MEPEADRTEPRGLADPRGAPPSDRPPRLGLLLGAAIIAAPFLALLYGLDAGLLVMALALAAVGLLAVLSARDAEPDLRHRLLVVAAVNGVLAVACLLLLLARQ